MESTSYHDTVPEIRRLEIGFMWYAQNVHPSGVNTCGTYLLLQYGFEVLQAQFIGFRADNYNFKSQRAIERAGAKRDGVRRHHKTRADGTIHDTVMYSISAAKCSEVKPVYPMSCANPVLPQM